MRRDVRKNGNLRVQDERDFRVIPERIHFREVAQIECVLLKATVVDEDFEPEQQGIDVPVDLIKGALGRAALL